MPDWFILVDLHPNTSWSKSVTRLFFPYGVSSQEVTEARPFQPYQVAR